MIKIDIERSMPRSSSLDKKEMLNFGTQFSHYLKMYRFDIISFHFHCLLGAFWNTHNTKIKEMSHIATCNPWRIKSLHDKHIPSARK